MLHFFAFQMLCIIIIIGPIIVMKLALCISITIQRNEFLQRLLMLYWSYRRRQPGIPESFCEFLVHLFVQRNKEACIRGITKHDIFKRLDAPTTAAFKISNRLPGHALVRLDRFLNNHAGYLILASVKETSQFVRNTTYLVPVLLVLIPISFSMMQRPRSGKTLSMPL